MSDPLSSPLDIDKHWAAIKDIFLADITHPVNALNHGKTAEFDNLLAKLLIAASAELLLPFIHKAWESGATIGEV